jgi:electron transport complex protein RnfB
VGARRQMHTVVAQLCTGCELCIAPCPVDCITMVPRALTEESPSAEDNRLRFRAHTARVAHRLAEQAQLLAARKLGASGHGP